MSNFESRESVERMIATRKSIEGEPLTDDQVAAARLTLDHPSFDTMSIDGRRAFHQSRLTHHGFEEPTGPSDMVMLAGWMLLCAGALVAALSFVMQTAVDSTTGGEMIGDTYVPMTTSSVINIGLLQHQLMVFECGLALAIGGFVMLGSGVVRAAIALRTAPAEPSEQG